MSSARPHALTAVVAFIALVLAGIGADAARARTVAVTVDPERLGRVVENRFLGLSFEASGLPQVGRNATRGNLVALLRSLGPGVLRFGGGSVDANTAFSEEGTLPSWATNAITPDDFDRLGKLARRTGWRIRLAVPLARYDPQAAAREIAVAARRLGPALAAVEIGNEPNAFPFFGLRPGTWGYADYLGEVRAYRRAIAAAAPGVRIAGPDTAFFDGFGWLEAFARDERPALLTPHYYPLNNCSSPAPTIADLLSPALAREEARTINTFAAIARRYRLKVRLGETNNVGCRGKPGVSDTFAAALWALRYMLAGARAGLDGVNFHTLTDDCDSYAAICARNERSYRRGQLRAMPEWYALLLFRHLAGARFAKVYSSARPPALALEAFRRPDGGLDVMAVNTEPRRGLELAIGLAGREVPRSGVLLSLTAPGLRSAAGVRLAGAQVSRDGAWRPVRSLPRIVARSGRLRVRVPAASAVLIRTERTAPSAEAG